MGEGGLDAGEWRMDSPDERAGAEVNRPQDAARKDCRRGQTSLFCAHNPPKKCRSDPGARH